MAAGSPTVFAMHAGMLNFMKVNDYSDYVPCDYAVNKILVATCYTALDTTPNLNIMHAASSDKQQCWYNAVI